ncbi:RNA helicase [Teratosphaeria destructans]|uniref:RNA helicase n=1 Tax=Teratosphaeria destructans TaxID=418781 RepID=A0A9W7SKK7_9PEZI|nr:RNA helicase [Teratosphaeria destructans]
MNYTHGNLRHGSRSRSRPPHRADRARDVKRQRSRSPHRHSHHHRHRRSESNQVSLPFRAQALHKRDLAYYRPLFADYLDLQKRKNIEELDEEEVKGRWKSFLGKWNRGELAEGWYDPDTKRRADERHVEPARGRAVPGAKLLENPEQGRDEEVDDEDDDDGYGPALPEGIRNRQGPTVPGSQDLQHRQELADEDREARIAGIRFDRKMDRKTQKERLEELVPRPDPGSRERQLEKKRDAAAVNREFKDAKDGGQMEEMGEDELMGGGDGVNDYRARLKANERKKTEREIRKEEVLRAREAEREERRKGFRAKEERTMEMLKSLARQRFGSD